MSERCYLGSGWREFRVPCTVCSALLGLFLLVVLARAYWIELTLIATAFLAGALIF